MGKIAIDIALLLPEEIENICIEINQKSKKIRPLQKDDYLPHITLAMGIVDEKDIKLIQDFLQNLKAKEIELLIESIRFKETPEGNESAFNITNNSALQNLHETISDYLKQYFQKGASVEMLYGGDETGITGNTALWLDTHSEKAYENYWPHITLNCYDVEIKLPIKFKVDTIALCHVGDGVTCRKILSGYKLN